MIRINKLPLPGLLEIVPDRFGDERGFFSEVWSRQQLHEAGIDADFVQDNHSYSAAAGVLRGLHFQAPPFAQAKLVRVTRGSIFDVAIDIRHGSPSFGRWAGLTLSAGSWNQVFVPEGFAHGFLTLEPHCEVLYKVTAPYAPQHDRGIRYDDPALGIEWPPVEGLTLSEKDRSAPLLADIEAAFTFP